MAAWTRAALVAGALAASGCSHAWDDYDPLLGASSAATSSAGSTAGGGGSGASSSTTSTTGPTTTSGSGASGGAATVGSGGAGAGAAGGSGGMGGGVIVKCQAANATDQFTDDFGGAVLDPEWDTYSYGGVVLAQKGGEAVVTIGASASNSTFGHFQTAKTFNLTGCYALVHVTQTCDPATNGYGSLIASIADDTYLEILSGGGELECKYTIGGAQTYVLPAVPFDPVNDAWWRLREQGGTTFWETSADGTTWQVRASVPNPIDVTAVLISLAGGTYQPEPIAPGEMHFDDFNLPP